MKRLVIMAASALVLGGAPAYAEPLESWLGDWVGVSEDDLPELSIREEGGEIYVSAAGSCSPSPCQWGEVRGVAYAPSAAVDVAEDTTLISASWDEGFGIGTLVLRYASSGTIHATYLREFTDGSGRSNYTTIWRVEPAPEIGLVPGVIGEGVFERLPDGIRDVLRPIAGLSFEEDCIGFDSDDLAVEQQDGTWKLVEGTMWMLDAGAGNQGRLEMLEAQRIANHYGLSQQCFIGRPDASLAYWLTASGAPVGALDGEDCVSIDPNGLSVRDDGGRFTILSGSSHAAFSAPDEAEANQIVELIEHYGFTRSCFVGRPGPSMAYLRR